jgi:hypothetical protein
MLLAFVAIALAALAAQAAAEPETLTLACEGTVTDPANWPRPKPVLTISMGIIVNLKARTVTGFISDYRPGVSDYRPVATIDRFDDMHITFRDPAGTMQGSIDRVTGAVEASTTIVEAGAWENRRYSLKCTATERKF